MGQAAVFLEALTYTAASPARPVGVDTVGREGEAGGAGGRGSGLDVSWHPTAPVEKRSGGVGEWRAWQRNGVVGVAWVGCGECGGVGSASRGWVEKGAALGSGRVSALGARRGAPAAVPPAAPAAATATRAHRWRATASLSSLPARHRLARGPSCAPRPPPHTPNRPP